MKLCQRKCRHYPSFPTTGPFLRRPNIIQLISFFFVVVFFVQQFGGIHVAAVEPTSTKTAESIDSITNNNTTSMRIEKGRSDFENDSVKKEEDNKGADNGVGRPRNFPTKNTIGKTGLEQVLSSKNATTPVVMQKHFVNKNNATTSIRPDAKSSDEIEENEEDLQNGLFSNEEVDRFLPPGHRNKRLNKEQKRIKAVFARKAAVMRTNLERSFNALGFPSGQECRTSEHPRFAFTEGGFQRLLNLPSSVPAVGDLKGVCDRITNNLALPMEPLTDEEKAFPLAYAMVVHESAPQVYLMLASVYQPQNLYCMAVDEAATPEFKAQMKLLGKCFPSNIFIMDVPQVGWGGYGVVNALITCVRALSERHQHGWRYVQYMSGSDLPLKTNLEMVRIFKQLRGTVNAEVTTLNPGRLPKEPKSPLPVYKSSMSALLPRAAVDTMFKSKPVLDFLEFLKRTSFPDESIWASITGNPQVVNIPGGFDASAVFERIQQEEAERKNGKGRTKTFPVTPAEPFTPDLYYISRYQLWPGGADDCHGGWVRWSCAFGMADVPRLLRRAEPIVHKLYLHNYPDAFLCLYRMVRERAYDVASQMAFRGNRYALLPQVRMARHPTLKPRNVNFLDIDKH